MFLSQAIYVLGSLQFIRTILGKSDDPMLPRNSVDAVLLMKTYHEVAQPIVLLQHVRAAMRRGTYLASIGISAIKRAFDISYNQEPK